MKVSVLGTGSWGTSLSKVLAENGHQVMMWGRDTDAIEEINAYKTNKRYLKETVLPESIVATMDLKETVEGAEFVLIVVPTSAMRSVVTQLKAVMAELKNRPTVIHATKGLEPHTHLRMSQVIEEVLADQMCHDTVVLSGPSHAEEVARRDLTTVTAASKDLDVAKKVQQLFMNQYFRVYTNSDVLGVELGAALKNIIALGAGVLVGLGYGDNAKAGLVTRGLAEISRLGISMGADPLTFLGLSGVGDLVVTCTSPHSRNWQAGRLLAEGKTKEEVEVIVDMVVEGIKTTEVAYELAQEQNVEMPITNAIYDTLYRGVPVKEAVEALMSREGKKEVSLKD